MPQYDVFISCKSEDYKDAQAIYEYLKSRDIYAFLAPMELREMGDAEYRRAIIQSLSSANHCIIFASKAEYIMSEWVFYEWDLFVNALLKGRKPNGNVITILKDVSTDELPFDLLKYQAFSFDNYKDKILRYVETPASAQRKEEGRIRAQKEEEVKNDITEYKRSEVTLGVISNRIIEGYKTLGCTEKKCPVCDRTNPLESSYCSGCGWAFIPVFEPEPAPDKDQLLKAKSVWDTAEKNVSDLHAQISRKDEALACVNKELSSVKQQYEEEKIGRRKAEDELRRLDAERKAWEEEKKEQAAFNGHEYVDLGLPSGLLWATCNVGAKTPEQSGDYFAWGETAPKKSYTTGTYHNTKNQLELSDDAVHVNWGGNWRMPTREEWEELCNHCKSKWTKQNGMEGRLFTSKSNKNIIFLPAAGYRNGSTLSNAGSYGFFWSSSLCPDHSNYAFGCGFNSGSVGPSDWVRRYYGRSVRPVASPSPSQNRP